MCIYAYIYIHILCIYAQFGMGSRSSSSGSMVMGPASLPTNVVSVRVYVCARSPVRVCWYVCARECVCACWHTGRIESKSERESARTLSGNHLHSGGSRQLAMYDRERRQWERKRTRKEREEGARVQTPAHMCAGTNFVALATRGGAILFCC